MKKIATAVLLFTGLVLVVWAASPIPLHPPAPGITATKAIPLAAQSAGAATNTARYCSSVALDEGGMVPAPRGSARHWVVTFQDAGGERAAVTRVYVDMEGQASDAVPPMGKWDGAEHGVAIEQHDVEAVPLHQAVFAFRRYEDASLRYTGIESHPGLTHYGLCETVVLNEWTRPVCWHK